MAETYAARLAAASKAKEVSASASVAAGELTGVVVWRQYTCYTFHL